MSTVGVYSSEEFTERFPLDFGSDMRGSMVTNVNDVVLGVIIAHQLKSGEVCAGSVLWSSFNDKSNPLWRLLSRPGAPITIDPSIQCINCGEGKHGYLHEGVWQTI